MKKGCLVGIAVGLVILVVVVALAGSFISTRNRIVAMDEDINGKWAQVDNALQRRADLIPNLVATVKGYAAHEQGILTEIADARSRLIGAGSQSEKAAAAGQLEGALSRLLVVVENYPQLKADTNFLKLQDELAGTENRLSVERMRYNESVQAYNAFIRRFPASIVAGMMNAEKRTYFEISEGAREVPKVDFSTP